LPSELFQALKTEAATQGISATVIAREALAAWLNEQKRQRIAQELRAYALEVVGTSDDLDPAWEQAGLENLAQNLEPWPQDQTSKPYKQAKRVKRATR
jgi:plasmid stability protein